MVVSIYSDFKRNTNQATMLLNWVRPARAPPHTSSADAPAQVRSMHLLRLRCVIAVCQHGGSLEARCTARVTAARAFRSSH